MPRTRAMARKRIKRWFTFFFGVPRTLYEYVVTVDLSNTFRQHLVWSKKSSELKELVTARYSSSTVFLSLLVSSEIGILYSPSKPADRIREALIEERYGEPEYWTGLFVCLAIFFSVAALISNFTAWSVFMSLSNENAPIILRSTLGLYAAQLPSRLVTCAIYLFLCVVLLSCWVIMPDNAALFLVCFGLVLLFHIINTFSSISRIVIHSGAMSSIPIFESGDVEDMEPWELSDALISRTLVAKKTDISINGQYKIDYQEILRDVEEGKITFPISAQELDRRNKLFIRNRLKGRRNLEARNGTSFHDTSSTREQSIVPSYDASSNSAILEDL